MSDFNHREWFKKQYLEEGMSDEEIHAIKRYEELSNEDKLKLAKIQAMMDRERSLREDTDILESQFDDLNQVVRNIHHVGEYDSLEEAAAKAMERIGQEFGISFEFGRDY